jgi:phosphonate transport system substrate-binding protein
MTCAPLRVYTFLAPNMLPVYAYLARRLGQRLGRPAKLIVAESYEQLDDADVAFVCGLAYVESADDGSAPVEPVAAPVLQGARFGGRPVYFSDVIVRRDRPWRSFADLRGRSWAYNEPHSQSGFGIVCHQLARAGETLAYFGCTVQSGWHERSIEMVCDGDADAAAVDAQVLAVALRERPELRYQLRAIDSLGPSTIQPVVVARRLADGLKVAIRAELLALGNDPTARPHLAHGYIERFVAMDDNAYDDIRAMREVKVPFVGSAVRTGSAILSNGPRSGPYKNRHLPAMSRQ